MNPVRFLHSWKHAWHGIQYAWRHEQSFRIQVWIALGVILATVVIPLAVWEQTVIILLIGMVLILELFNTVVERLLDAMQPRLARYVEELKDLTAAAVLLAALVAAIIGSVIFLPKVFHLFF